MLAWYRDLIRLRRTTPSLNDGEPGNAHVSFDEQDKWLCLMRGPVAVCCNLGDSSHSFSVTPGSEIALASQNGLQIKDGSLALPPDSIAAIFSPRISEMANGFHRSCG
jgi:maltooligosyltrehalose trehalohydrolase